MRGVLSDGGGWGQAAGAKVGLLLCTQLQSTPAGQTHTNRPMARTHAPATAPGRRRAVRQAASVPGRCQTQCCYACACRLRCRACCWCSRPRPQQRKRARRVGCQTPPLLAGPCRSCWQPHMLRTWDRAPDDVQSRKAYDGVQWLAVLRGVGVPCCSCSDPPVLNRERCWCVHATSCLQRFQ